MSKVVIISDPALYDYGPSRPPFLIARFLSHLGIETEFVSPVIGKEVRDILNSSNVKTISLGVPDVFARSSKAILSLWILESLVDYLNRKFIEYKKANGDGDLIIFNFSNIFHIPSHIWYAQGVFSRAFKEIDWSEWPFKLRVLAVIGYPLVRFLDFKHLVKMKAVAKYIIANSDYTYKMYVDYGLTPHSIIYPPLDPDVFHPTTNNPEGNYVLTYIGKETDFKAIKELLKRGVKIISFGGKERYVPRDLMKYRNFKYLGNISNKSLAELYSNAKFTLFPFTHEPFGYIPIESMACATPVLTYKKEGPGFVVKEGQTGWIARNRSELVAKAIRLWSNGFDEKIRDRAYSQAKYYYITHIGRKWLTYYKLLTNGSLEISDLSILLAWKEIFKKAFDIFKGAVSWISSI